MRRSASEENLLCILPLLIPGIAYSSIDGNRLIEALDGHKENNRGYRAGYFDGYVMGVADTSSGILWCSSKNVTGGQVRKIVEKYLVSHPEELHKTADSLVVDALREPFPCKK